MIHPFMIFLKDFCKDTKLNYSNFNIEENYDEDAKGIIANLYYRNKHILYLFRKQLYDLDYNNKLKNDKIDFYNWMLKRKYMKFTCRLKL